MIYIQSNTERTLPHHFDCASAMYGAIESGLPYRLTSFEEVASGKFDMVIKKHGFVGSVEFMREVFKRIGLKDVRVPKNSNRISETLTLGEAHKKVDNGEKLFIKPLEIKLFSGLLLDGCIYSCLQNLPEDTKVMAYQPFDKKIISEWRIYIFHQKIEDARNYSGSVLKMPSESYIKKVIDDDCDDFPISYTIDVAIMEDGSQEVVEFNDMWAIGNYGVPNDIYLKMLTRRYFEIIKNI